MEASGSLNVAGLIASVVPLHCVICFEEFTAGGRPPVVLPCGHTFVCAICSKRLTRCMECRQPLFLPAPPQPRDPKKMNNNNNNRRGSHSPTAEARRSYQQQQQQRQQQQQQQQQRTPLPIPKNLVLLNIMEAVERQRAFEGAGERAQRKLQNIASMDEYADYVDAEGCVVNAVTTLSGPCGTYASRDPKELEVLRTDPRAKSIVIEEEEEEEEKTPEGEDDDDDQNDEQMLDDRAATTSIQRGQTVQVAGFDDGVAKLARNAGYVKASKSQLVKVGGPKDSSCRLEGLLATVLTKERDFKHQLDENHQMQCYLRELIEKERAKASSSCFPVISDGPELTALGSSKDSSSDTDEEDDDSEEQQELDEEISLQTFDSSSRAEEEGRVTVGSGGGLSDDELAADMCGIKYHNSIDNSDLDNNSGNGGGNGAGGGVLPNFRRKESSASTSHVDEIVFGCGAAFLTESAEFVGENLARDNHHHHRVAGGGGGGDSGPEYRHDSPARENVRRVVNTFKREPPMSSLSFDGIDFRTGLSGHRALTSKSVSMGHHAPHGEVRMMSEHRGVCRIKSLAVTRRGAAAAAGGGSSSTSSIWRGANALKENCRNLF